MRFVPEDRQKLPRRKARADFLGAGGKERDREFCLPSLRTQAGFFESALRVIFYIVAPSIMQLDEF